MTYKPHDYQQVATAWIKDKPRCGLFLDMGLGKTVSTLTAIRDLIDECDIEKALVVAPKKVAETTWTTEAEKWDHLKSLRLVKVLGTAKQREEALRQDADVYVTSRDLFVKLVEFHKGRLPYDMIVLDELSSFKSSTSQRFKAMKIVGKVTPRIIGLTGTPAPNGMLDLWAEIYCLDQGERLGKFKTRYREAYFHTIEHNHIPIKVTIRKGAEEIIKNKIADICLSMQAKDYLTLPPLTIITERVKLSLNTMKKYLEFEREKVMEFAAHGDDSDTVVADSAAALMNKLTQFSNGAIYDEERNVHAIHDEKLERLAEIVEAANGASILCFYQYQHDIPRITEKLKGYRVRIYSGEQDLRDWNNGGIDVLLAHPASTAYGLNMQQGGHYIVWFGTGWNLEYYQQANARLHRQGQRHQVIVYNLVCEGTVDERAALALEQKKTVQQGLLDSLKYLTTKYVEG